MRKLFIVGLRNYDQAFSGTRHNVGAAALHALARRHSLMWTKKGDTDQAEWLNDVVLVLPHTFMNLSGKPVARLFPQKAFATSDLLVVHDELELQLGQARIKQGGSARGHNGVKSIIDCLGGITDFPRVLVGIDRPASRDAKAVSGHVLGKFTRSEDAQLETGLSLACDTIEQFVIKRQQPELTKKN